MKKLLRPVFESMQRFWLLWAIVAGIFAAVLSLILGLDQPVWFDEGYSILLAQQSWSELLALTAVDAHPPLYYLLLKAWGTLFGFEELALRSLSAVLLGGAVTSGVALVKTLFSPRVALVATPFLALAPFALRYGYEIRMYALALLIGVVATILLVKAQQSNRWRHWIGYAVMVALGMFTLYMTVAVWLTHAVWLLVHSIREKKPFKAWRWFRAYLIAVGLFALYIPTFVTQLFNSVLPGVGSELTLTKLADLFSFQFLYLPEWSLGGWGSIFVLTAIVLLITALVRLTGTLKKNDLKGVLLLVSLVVGPIIFFALTSLPPRDPIFIVRYAAHVSLFLPLLIGVVVALSWQRGFRSTAIALGLLTIGLLGTGIYNLGVTGNFNFERLQKPLTTSVRAAAECTANTTVVADDPYTYIDSVYYFDDCDLRFYAENPLERKGGYAPLADSDRRIESSTVLSADTLYHLRWYEAEPSFVVEAPYRFVDSTRYDKQVIDRYIRTTEE